MIKMQLSQHVYLLFFVLEITVFVCFLFVCFFKHYLIILWALSFRALYQSGIQMSVQKPKPKQLQSQVQAHYHFQPTMNRWNSSNVSMCSRKATRAILGKL